MTAKRRILLAHADARRFAAECIAAAPEGYVVTVQEPTRNLEQNALLWVLLTEFSRQLEWPVNGRMTKLSPDEWKTILSAAFSRESQRVAMGIDGGMVMLGMRTSQMGKRQFAEFIEFIGSVAADRGVTLCADAAA